jgi:uncharacterized protein with ParB-like and HNH nuclease domain
MENNLTLKTVNELCLSKFYIPSYQRGYRWNKYEVLDLLNDIAEFQPRLVGDTDEKTWYCLQPVVVKDNNGVFEVIDGQQRLTTIYLLLHYLNQDYKEDRQDKLFIIEYETREKSRDFLSNINVELQDDNIDFYYINKAYETINEWFDNKGANFDKNEFRSKFKFNTKVIWYQSFEENPIDIFTRINIGKIPLTNAELIKALFLNSSNFDSKESEKLRQRQFEIANEWDNMEHSLQNDSLWYFISKKQIKNNRIELIFDLMNTEKDIADAYSTFRFFAKQFKGNKNALEEVWANIKQYYQRFNEWFNERDLYHKIGFLLYAEYVTINELIITSSKLSKYKFKQELDRLIKESLRTVKLSEIQYGDKEVKQVLLLYNIVTMLKSSADNSYFPFQIFINNAWDIEHITSIKESMPEGSDRIKWINDAKVFIDESTTEGLDLRKRAEKCKCDIDDEFKILFEEIVSHFNSNVDDGDVNDISNLTLLDSETNRGYKNAVFPLKRKTIIDKDKQGVFIPLCTKNVFLKYFSAYPPKISFWTQDDRDNYIKDLTSMLSPYISE